GSLLWFLPKPDRSAARPVLHVRRLVPAGLFVLALAAVAGIPFGDSPVTTATSAHGAGYPRSWALGGFVDRSLAETVRAEGRRPAAPGVVTVVSGSSPYRTYLLQLELGALQRTSGPLGPGMYQGALDDPMRIENMVVLTPGAIDLVVFNA